MVATIALAQNDQPVGITNPLAINSSVANAASNGCTTHKLISAATTNATSVKASAGAVAGGYLFNTSAAVKFVKFYNKASAPTVGTDIPVFTLPVPVGLGVGLAEMFDNFGMYFSTGIAYAITGAAPDADATVVVAGDVIVNLNWA